MTWYQFLGTLSITLPTSRTQHESRVLEINPIVGLVGNHNPCTYTALWGHSKGNNTAHWPYHSPAILSFVLYIHHIYINCWLPVYRWSVMDKQVTSTPPPPYLEMGGGSGYLHLHYWTPVDWEPAINVDMVISARPLFDS